MLLIDPLLCFPVSFPDCVHIRFIYILFAVGIDDVTPVTVTLPLSRLVWQ